MATHSPILLAHPGAQIFSFDSSRIEEVAYQDTTHYKIYKQFFIDTILANFPCPAVFLHKDTQDGSEPIYRVVDGKQRLLTIFDFQKNGFALAKDLVGAKTLSEVIEIQSTFARKQFDAMSGQVKELLEITRKAMMETGKPMRESVEKAFQEFKVS